MAQDWRRRFVHRPALLSRCMYCKSSRLADVLRQGRTIGAMLARLSRKIWLVSFMHCSLGFFDDDTYRLAQHRPPSGAKVFTPVL